MPEGGVVEVEGDDQLGVGGDGGGEDVPVLGVVGHRRLKAVDLGGVDFGFLERLTHCLLDPGGLLGGDAVFDEVAGHLLEDAGAPERRVELELGEPEQRVAEGEGVEDVGVEDGAEGHGRARLAALAGG
jgi:hypothetical protein